MVGVAYATPLMQPAQYGGGPAYPFYCYIYPPNPFYTYPTNPLYYYYLQSCYGHGPGERGPPGR